MFCKLVDVHGEGATSGFVQASVPCKLLTCLWENINLKIIGQLSGILLYSKSRIQNLTVQP